MSETRVQEVVAARLTAFNVTECEIISVVADDKGAFDVRLGLSPAVGKRPGSISTQANALAVQVISALNTATESDVDCGMLRCDLEPLTGTSEKPVMIMIAKFSIVVSKAPTPEDHPATPDPTE